MYAAKFLNFSRFLQLSVVSPVATQLLLRAEREFLENNPHGALRLPELNSWNPFQFVPWLVSLRLLLTIKLYWRQTMLLARFPWFVNPFPHTLHLLHLFWISAHPTFVTHHQLGKANAARARPRAKILGWSSPPTGALPPKSSPYSNSLSHSHLHSPSLSHFHHKL